MRADGLPAALAGLHQRLRPGDGVALTLSPFRASLAPLTLADLAEGGGWGLLDGELLVRQRTLPDTVGPGMRLLVCGLNPSLVAADAGYGYAGSTNRFWPAATAAGVVEVARDPRRALAADGVGMTDLVKRATPGAADLSAADYRRGAARVERLVRRLRPARVLFVGLGGWRAAVDPGAGSGWQPGGFGGVPAYVMPSTSGRNARSSLPELVGHLAAALGPPPEATGRSRRVGGGGT